MILMLSFVALGLFSKGDKNRQDIEYEQLRDSYLWNGKAELCWQTLITEMQKHVFIAVAACFGQWA